MRKLAMVLAFPLAACADPPPLAEYVDPAVDVVSLSDWDYGGLRGGWAAEQLIGRQVVGAGGERIGEAENIVIGPEGRIASLVVAVDEGFLGIGGAHVSVPWSDVRLGAAEVRVPVSKANARQYGLFRESSGREGPRRSWKATELLDDYVRLRGGVEYGWVEDIIFSRGGEVQAVVVARDLPLGAGRYAVPYYGYGYGFDAGLGHYALPYGPAEFNRLPWFDYGFL